MLLMIDWDLSLEGKWLVYLAGCSVRVVGLKETGFLIRRFASLHRHSQWIGLIQILNLDHIHMEYRLLSGLLCNLGMWCLVLSLVFFHLLAEVRLT